MIQEKLTSSNFYRMFGDINEMIDEAKSPINNTYRQFQFSSWDQVLEMARKPHPEMDEQVNRMVDEVGETELPDPVCIRRKLRFSEDSGDEVDLERLRGGQSYWRTMERGQSFGQQTKRIFVNLSAQITIPVNELQWRGVAAITLMKILEDAGYQVELWGVSTVRNAYADGRGHGLAVLLKDVHGLIDVDGISTALSGWFYRSIWFSSKRRRDCKIEGHLGQPSMVTSEDINNITGVDYSPSDDFIIQDTFSKYAAIYEVKRVLNMFAEPVPPVDYDDPYEVPVQRQQEESRPETPAQAARRRKQEALAEKRWAKERALLLKRNRES